MDLIFRNLFLVNTGFDMLKS